MDALAAFQLAILKGRRVEAQGEKPVLVAARLLGQPAGRGKVRLQMSAEGRVLGVHRAGVVLLHQLADGRQVLQRQLSPGARFDRVAGRAGQGGQTQRRRGHDQTEVLLCSQDH